MNPDKPRPVGYVVGRITDYKPEYCQMLIEHAQKGGSYAAFAGKILCDRGTLNNWAIDNPEFFNAKKIAYYASLNYWEQLGLDFAVTTTETVIDGRTKNTVTKQLNSAIWIYNMKCRFQMEWTEIQKIKQITDDENKTNSIPLSYIPKSDRNGNNGV